MDQFSGEGVLKKLASSSKGYSLTRDTASSRARKAEICSRMGSGNHLNLRRGAQNSYLDKRRYSRSALLDIGSSSGSSPSVRNKRESSEKPQKTLASHLANDSSDTSSVLDEPELQESVPPPGKIRREPNDESGGVEVGEVNLDAVATSSVYQSSRTRMTSSSGDLLSSRHVVTVSPQARNLIQAKRAKESGGVQTNDRTNSIANGRLSNESSSNSSVNRRKNLLKKATTCGEASTSNGMKKGGKQSLDGHAAHNFEQGVAISDSETRARRARCVTADRDAVRSSSARTRRQNGYSEPRHSTQSNSSTSTSTSPVMSLRMRHAEILNEMSSSLHRPSETSSGRLAARSRPGSSSERSHRALPSDIAEMSFTHSLLNDDGFSQYHMEGIAEVLLALERIGQDDELSYEQVIALENNLFLNGMSFYDQHRDMRLDIDNMSYEELLALEERMGTVSTALTEEELINCLKREVHHSTPLPGSTTWACRPNDDLKCSICQEEYVNGDEVGRLPCEHQYHMACAQQWLRLKNWCPICKGSATSSSSPPPS
ncbi:hypothetical protein MLD38_005995 [Melastoma candidum]|uniref:Uncharacterized protein n=1 Tax=Melastoma candidum TaxID=119954 RepID=A0ACB9RLI2_9MYRT|nr:hypothetical protein MLD38_005995 [Melastoma candidum]